MGAFIYYRKEERHYREFFDTRLTADETLKVARRIIRHFKLSIKVCLSRRRYGGLAYYRRGLFWKDGNLWRRGKILLPIPCSLGMLVHEIGHIRSQELGGERGHTKRLWRNTKPIYTFARRYIKAQMPDQWEGNDIY